MIEKIQNSKFKSQKGYVALVALLIVAAAALTIGIAVSLRGIEEIQISYSASQAAKAKSLANTCLEEGLERLRNNWASYSGSLPIEESSCIIDIVINGSNATLTAVGTVDVYTQKIQIGADNNLNIISWQEY